MSNARKSASFLILAALAAAAGASAQEAPGAWSGCYVPPTGLVYVVGAPGAPDECLDQRHVSFTWPDLSHVTADPGHAGAPPGGNPGNTPTVPSGAVMHFDLTACPSGWTEMEAARGRTLTGLPEGGTLGGAVGLPLSDREDREHGHLVPELSANTGAAGTHRHEIAGVTSSAGEHAHRWAVFGTANWFSWTHSGELRRLTNWTNGIGSEGEGDYPLARTRAASLSVYTEPTEGHEHAFEAEASDAGGHVHEIDLPDQKTGAGHTGDVMPYLQLLTCRKD